MMELNYDNFVTRLCSGIDGFQELRDSHFSDNGEVLPHVLLGDLSRFLSNEARVKGEKSESLQQAMRFLEAGLRSSDPRLQDRVVVSFLENLDVDDPGFRTIRLLFGDELEKCFLRLTRG